MTKFWQALVVVTVMQGATAPTWASDERTVSVKGQGEVRVAPDRARLSLAVDSVHVDLKHAEAEVTKVVGTFLAQLQRLGIEERHISTTAIQVQPETIWNEKTRRSETVGYRVRRDMSIAVQALNKLGDVLVAATAAGINHIQPPELTSSNHAAHGREALALAAKDAEARARALASALGSELGTARRIDDGSVQMAPPPFPMVKAMSMGDAVPESSSGALGLSPGEITYAADVHVVFDLRSRR